MVVYIAADLTKDSSYVNNQQMPRSTNQTARSGKIDTGSVQQRSKYRKSAKNDRVIAINNPFDDDYDAVNMQKASENSQQVAPSSARGHPVADGRPGTFQHPVPSHHPRPPAAAAAGFHPLHHGSPHPPPPHFRPYLSPDRHPMPAANFRPPPACSVASANIAMTSQAPHPFATRALQPNHVGFQPAPNA